MTGINGSNAFDTANARAELLRAVGLCHSRLESSARIDFFSRFKLLPGVASVEGKSIRDDPLAAHLGGAFCLRRW